MQEFYPILDNPIVQNQHKFSLLANLLQEDLDTLGEWEHKWLMEFNVDKCITMHATRAKSKVEHEYTLHSKPLMPVKDSKYLGVTLSDDLTWYKHIGKLVGDG